MSHMQTKAPLNLALIGCGRIAESHLEAIAQNSACTLSSAVDMREEAAQKVAAQFGCHAFTDYREIVNHENVDAVIICTPPATHAEIALFFLEHGIHVLCEKPLAVRLEDAVLMAQTAAQKGLILMMASKFRYVQDIATAKSLLAAGLLGEVILFENVFSGKVDMTQRWNSQKEFSGGGVLIDNGSHSVDIARNLFGPIVEVQAMAGKRVQPIEVEDAALLHLRTASHVVGMIDLSWSIHKERESFIDIYGTKGIMHIGWKGSKYKLYENSTWVPFGAGYDKLQAFSAQLENFVGAIKREEAPVIDLNDAVASVEVIETAYKAMHMNQWLKIEGTEFLTLYRKAA